MSEDIIPGSPFIANSNVFMILELDEGERIAQLEEYSEAWRWSRLYSTYALLYMGVAVNASLECTGQVTAKRAICLEVQWVCGLQNGMISRRLVEGVIDMASSSVTLLHTQPWLGFCVRPRFNAVTTGPQDSWRAFGVGGLHLSRKLYGRRVPVPATELGTDESRCSVLDQGPRIGCVYYIIAAIGWVWADVFTPVNLPIGCGWDFPGHKQTIL
ncbi:hypothetical protein Tco_0195648 [Tanacetum coccineum]